MAIICFGDILNSRGLGDHLHKRLVFVEFVVE
jgi:hypothetical protein